MINPLSLVLYRHSSMEGLENAMGKANTAGEKQVNRLPNSAPSRLWSFVEKEPAMVVKTSRSRMKTS